MAKPGTKCSGQVDLAAIPSKPSSVGLAFRIECRDAGLAFQYHGAGHWCRPRQTERAGLVRAADRAPKSPNMAPRLMMMASQSELASLTKRVVGAKTIRSRAARQTRRDAWRLQVCSGTPGRLYSGRHTCPIVGDRGSARQAETENGRESGGARTQQNQYNQDPPPPKKRRVLDRRQRSPALSGRP